jgi:NADPH:quinone reductase-like Zn-dependent oxidoreductase
VRSTAAADASDGGGRQAAPDAGEVLVKVLAMSVNAADWHSMRGKPLFSRATLVLLRPKHQILGVDIAGQVEAAGSGVTQLARIVRECCAVAGRWCQPLAAAWKVGLRSGSA